MNHSHQSAENDGSISLTSTVAMGILSEPVKASSADGTAVSLAGLEAAYLALCRKGLKGDVPALLSAIKIMLEVQPAVEDQANTKCRQWEDAVATIEKLGMSADILRRRMEEKI